MSKKYGSFERVTFLTLKKVGNANLITIQPPTLSGSYSLTLPDGDGAANQVLSTDGSGVLSWVAPSVDPTTLSDSDATRMGLKQYVNDTSYNGGNSTTVSGSGFTIGGTTWATTRGVFVPYEIQDGSWRLRLNLVGISSLATTTATLSVSGVTYKNTSAFYQACTAWWGTMLAARAYANPNSTDIITDLIGGSNTTISISADLELDSKPNWAY